MDGGACENGPWIPNEGKVTKAYSFENAELQRRDSRMSSWTSCFGFQYIDSTRVGIGRWRETHFRGNFSCADEETSHHGRTWFEFCLIIFLGQ